MSQAIGLPALGPKRAIAYVWRDTCQEAGYPVSLFWIVSLGLAACVALVWALVMLRTRSVSGRLEEEIGIYRDQLAEVERDLARGLIEAGDAERLRTEIARRILEADRSRVQGDVPATAPRGLSRAVAGLLAVVMVGGSAGLYATIGNPGLPDRPLALRLAQIEEASATRPTQEDVETMMGSADPPPPENATPEYLANVAQLRRLLAERPRDLAGHRLLVQHEAALGRYAAAQRAQAIVIELLGEAAPASALTDRAELMILATRGYVSPEAEELLTAALRREPLDQRTRYFAGLLMAQTGRPEAAYRLWAGVLADSPPEAPWVGAIRSQIAEVAAMAGRSIDPSELRGPTRGDVDAAADMTPAERTAMIEGMVESLAGRIDAEGGAPQEWAQLIRALGVLGQADRAALYWARAREAFEADREALQVIRPAARDAGVTE